MKYAFMVVLFSLSLAGCALEKTYGVPYSVWKTLTPEQQKTLAKYDEKRAQQKKEWIWKNAAEAQEAAAPVTPS